MSDRVVSRIYVSRKASKSAVQAKAKAIRALPGVELPNPEAQGNGFSFPIAKIKPATEQVETVSPGVYRFTGEPIDE